MVQWQPLAFDQQLVSHTGRFYSVLEKLGSGGNADTYLVLSTDGNTRGIPFAVKVFRLIAKPERLVQFQEEFRFLEECEHPSIMRVFDHGTYRDRYPFVVAEYLPVTLKTLIRDNSTSEIEKLCFIVQLLSALNHLSHLSPPIIHRDIKPANIFVKGQASVLGDFGLIKKLSDSSCDDELEVFKLSVGAGMPKHYRTPDLVAYFRNTAPLSIKSEVYQLGLVAAELFTGKNPQREAKRFENPIVLDELGVITGNTGEESTLAPQIKNLIQRMLTPEAEDRDDAADQLTAWYGLLHRAARVMRNTRGRVLSRN